MGARSTKNGVSGVHTHMTNSLNTPAEALEYAYPIRLRQYSLRSKSGGTGLHRGGDGIVREIEVLTDAQVTLLADRRSRGPYGLAGGVDGALRRKSPARSVFACVREKESASNPRAAVAGEEQTAEPQRALSSRWWREPGVPARPPRCRTGETPVAPPPRLITRSAVNPTFR